MGCVRRFRGGHIGCVRRFRGLIWGGLRGVIWCM